MTNNQKPQKASKYITKKHGFIRAQINVVVPKEIADAVATLTKKLKLSQPKLLSTLISAKYLETFGREIK